MPENYILTYYNKIKSGKIRVSKHLRQWYDRVVDELNHPNENVVFDIDKATRPIEFIERFCKNSKGKWAGKSVHLLLWQKAMIQTIYGFVYADSGYRRCTNLFCVCARKNGKTTLTSGLGLYAMFEEVGSEIYSVATTYKQASRAFDEALQMVRQSPELSSHIKKHKYNMRIDQTNSVFEPLHSKSESLDGLNASMAICDECHAWKDRNLYDVLNQSKSARTQPLIIVITTGGTVRNGIYDKLYEKSCRIIEGAERDDSFYPFIYELDNKDQIDDEKNWIMANPSLGQIKKIEDIRTDVNTARFDESAKTTMLTKDFNFRENASTSWLPFKVIDISNIFNIKDFSGSYFVGGVDLSESGDLTAASIILMHGKDYCKQHNLNPDIKYVYSHYWIPKNCADYKIKHDRVPYDIWQQKGLVSFSGENRIDYDDVKQWFLHIRNDFKILPISIGYDEWNAQQFATSMKNSGFKMEVVRQGYKTLSSSMKNLGYDFHSNLINYNADPVMKWCLCNCQIKMDEAGNIKPVHPKDRQKRNDGVSSMLDAYVMLEINLLTIQNLVIDK